MMRPPWAGRATASIERQVREEMEPRREQLEYMAAHDVEQHWRSRGEIAIREEMEAALERRRARRIRCAGPRTGRRLRAV